MMWVKIEGNPIPLEGKYVVKTERPHPGLKGAVLNAKVETTCTHHYDDKGKLHCTWGVTNQRVTHYLWEG